MTASLVAAPSTVCARCDGQMVVTKDAIGRERYRCPRCDRVTNHRPHPDEVLVPQTLVRLTALALPPVEPGQLRCQRCAKGLEGRARFCVDCLRFARAQAKRKPCPDCGIPFVPNRSNFARCSECAKKTRPPKVRLCTGCNRLSPHKAGRKTVSSCEHCRRPTGTRASRAYKPKPCLECGSTFQPSGPRARYCPECR